jgi:hypothetical protein
MHPISQETLKRTYTLSHAGLISYAMAVGERRGLHQ